MQPGLTTPLPKRHLHSLTYPECRTILALAFGFAPPDSAITTFCIAPGSPITIVSHGFSIILYEDGQILPSRSAQNVEGFDSAACFNAWKVVTYLNSLNMLFGTPAV
ncbi:hypothetical protein [Spirosoma sordidisoli]|uniref:Uncharacterized protein n=1 Tax=Spirosoma sordidisoli TaxID=2502893 RepID=A0A4V1RWC4_9BACT|nr:hypothetical protein [Spirosoma sordidisoli]RYC69778.1 hypothetical protein EQG79_14380 [Spirosoma sordidisoli]